MRLHGKKLQNVKKNVVVLPHIHVGDVWLQQSLCWVLLSPSDESQEILVVDDDEWLRGVEGLCERPPSDYGGGEHARDCVFVKSQLCP